MGLRYLIAAPRDGQAFPANLDSIMTGSGFERVAEGLRYRLYLNLPDRWARFAHGRGIVVGDLFERNDAEEYASISAGGIAEHANNLDDIIRRYWGGYVALLSNDRGMEIFRDPSGALPVYLIDRPDGSFVASDAPLLAEIGLYVPEINWSELARFFYTRVRTHKMDSQAARGMIQRLG